MWDAARMGRRAPAGKARYGQIETAPEKMDRAAFAAELRAELLEDAVALLKDAPEAVRIIGIVSRVFLVFFERNGRVDFVRRGVDLDLNLQFAQRLHHLAVKRRH